MQNYKYSDIDEFFKLKYSNEKYNEVDRSRVGDNDSFWNNGVIVIDVNGRVEKEAVMGYDDNHGEATKRALKRFGVTSIKSSMGVVVAESANGMDFVVFHTYAKCLFAFLTPEITVTQYNAIFSLICSKTDFSIVVNNGNPDIRYTNVVDFLKYLETLVSLDVGSGIKR